MRESLDSLRGQIFTGFEAICVNDGSTDSSLDILREYAAKDSRFIVIDQPNGGYGKAMNTGLSAAKGEYMAILEPDDLLPLGAYQAMMNVIQDKGQLDIVKGSTLGLRNGKQFPLYKKKATGKVFKAQDFPDVFEGGVATWSSLYRLDFLRHNEISYNESPGASFQDTGFHILTLAFAESICFTDAFTYIYRLDNPASSRQSADKVGVLSREWAITFGKLSRKPEVYKKVQAACVRRRVRSSIWDVERVSPQSRMDALSIFRTDLLEMKRAGMDFSMMDETMKAAVEEIIIDPAVHLTMKRARQRFSPLEPRDKDKVEVCRVLGIPLFEIKTYPHVTKVYFLGVKVIQIREKHPDQI